VAERIVAVGSRFPRPYKYGVPPVPIEPEVWMRVKPGVDHPDPNATTCVPEPMNDGGPDQAGNVAWDMQIFIRALAAREEALTPRTPMCQSAKVLVAAPAPRLRSGTVGFQVVATAQMGRWQWQSTPLHGRRNLRPSALKAHAEYFLE
jgi:hypothetical protein